MSCMCCKAAASSAALLVLHVLPVLLRSCHIAITTCRALHALLCGVSCKASAPTLTLTCAASVSISAQQQCTV
jgi:hypothetical protein